MIKKKKNVFTNCKPKICIKKIFFFFGGGGLLLHLASCICGEAIFFLSLSAVTVLFHLPIDSYLAIRHRWDLQQTNVWKGDSGHIDHDSWRYCCAHILFLNKKEGMVLSQTQSMLRRCWQHPLTQSMIVAAPIFGHSLRVISIPTMCVSTAR